MLDRLERVHGPRLRITQHLGQGGYRRPQAVRRIQPLGPVRQILAAEALLEHLAQRFRLCHQLFHRVVALVGGPLRLAERFAEARPVAERLRHHQQQPAPVASRVRVRQRVPRLAAIHLRGLLRRQQRGLQIRSDGPHPGQLQGDLRSLRLARLIAQPQRRERCGEDVQCRRVIALPPARHHRRVTRLPERPHDPGTCPECEEVEAPSIRVGAARAVAAERDVHHARIERLDRLEAEVVALDAMPRQVGDEDIHVRGQPPHQRRAARLFEVDHDRALAAVVQLEARQQHCVGCVRL